MTSPTRLSSVAQRWAWRPRAHRHRGRRAARHRAIVHVRLKEPRPGRPRLKPGTTAPQPAELVDAHSTDEYCRREAAAQRAVPALSDDGAVLAPRLDDVTELPCRLLDPPIPHSVLRPDGLA